MGHTVFRNVLVCAHACVFVCMLFLLCLLFFVVVVVVAFGGSCFYVSANKCVFKFIDMS